MKILLIGLLALSSWLAVSTYIYVCKIQGLCSEPETVQVDEVSNKDVMAADTLNQPSVQEEVVMPGDLIVYFEFDKSEFNSDAETGKYVDELKVYLGQNSQPRLIITGHTDANGSDEYNQALAYRRAQSAQRYFDSMGLPADKIQIESKGEKEPVDDNNTAAGRANNRRIIVTIKN